MKVLGIISALAFAPTVQSSFGILYRTNTVRTKKLVNCIFLGCCKLNVSLFGKGMEMARGVILVSVEVVQMSGEVVGLSGDGVWVSEVACKPGAQGGRQP